MWPPGLPANFGFVADAADVKTILDVEFAAAGIAEADRVALLVAHSRGALVATKFRAKFRAEYHRISIVSLEGSECTGLPTPSSYEDELMLTVGIELPEGFIQYVLAPIIPFLAGGVNVVLACINTDSFYAGQSVLGLPEPLIQILPVVTQRGYMSKYLLARYWDAAARVRNAWEHDYDGPSLAECYAVQGSCAGHPWWVSCTATDYLHIAAKDVCLQSDGTNTSCPSGMPCYCAEHVSLVQLGSFARVATERTIAFLEGPPMTTLTVSIQTDSYPKETTWVLHDANAVQVGSGGPFSSGNTAQNDVRVALTAGSYTFTIFDTYADGICCSHGNGSWTLAFGMQILHSGNPTFQNNASFDFVLPLPPSPPAPPPPP